MGQAAVEAMPPARPPVGDAYLRLVSARRRGCVVGYPGGCALEASACQRSQSTEASEIGVEGYLRVWEELHPAIEVVKIFDLFGAH